MTTKKPEPPTIPFASRDAWEAWLEGRHATCEGLWLKFAKKGAGIESVTYDQAVEVALCYGWIDGQARKFDEDYWLQRFTPRRPRSKWSKVNRQKAMDLIKRGKMKTAGLREVERPRPTAGGMPPMTRRAPPQCRTTCAGSWKTTRRFGSSSASSTAGTGTRSCTRSRTLRDPRRGRDASPSMWPCWPSKRSPIHETTPSCVRGALRAARSQIVAASALPLDLIH